MNTTKTLILGLIVTGSAFLFPHCFSIRQAGFIIPGVLSTAAFLIIIFFMLKPNAIQALARAHFKLNVT